MKFRYQEGTKVEIIGIPGRDIFVGEEGDFLESRGTNVVTLLHSKHYPGTYEIAELCDEFADEYGWAADFIESKFNFKIPKITNWKEALK